MEEKINYLWTKGHGLYILLGLLFIGIFISPIIITDEHASGIVIECVFALVLITGVFATPCRFSIRLGMLLIAVSAVIARVLYKYDHSSLFIATLNNALAALSLLAFSYLIIKHFLLNKCHLRYRITAAVAVYLIFGVLWSRLFELIYLLNPSSFSHTNLDTYSLMYFSFVTLLTIGYGDIVPVSTAARSLAILEGVVGQLYIVILITSLVSELSALHCRDNNN
jgi:hypothetical protein